MSKTLLKTKKIKTRQPMEMPTGILLDLYGIEQQNRASNPQSYKTELTKVEQPSPGSSREPGRFEHVRAESQEKVRTGFGDGHSRVYLQPMHLKGLQLNGLPSTTHDMGVVLHNQRYFFNAMMSRDENGTWLPTKNAPPKNSWYVVNEQGVAQPPDVVKSVFDLLFLAAELYYRSNYRDFVLAELAWYNNGIAEFEEMSREVATGKATDEEKKVFYSVRFSGNVGAMREAESKILEWLEENPE